MERVIAVGKLEDGRWGVENLVNTSDLTINDYIAIAKAVETWFFIHVEVSIGKGGEETKL